MTTTTISAATPRRTSRVRSSTADGAGVAGPPRRGVTAVRGSSPSSKNDTGILAGDLREAICRARPPGRARPASFAPSVTWRAGTDAAGGERAGVKTFREPGPRPGGAPGATQDDARPRPLPPARKARLGRSRQRLDRARRARPAAGRREADPVRARRPAGAPADRARGTRGARLAHPAIVALFAIGDDADAHYLVSELVEGPRSRALYATRASPIATSSGDRLALADALAHAHDARRRPSRRQAGERDRPRPGAAGTPGQADRLRRRARLRASSR